jgi:nucleoside-diphosphate-sugar epimerase
MKSILVTGAAGFIGSHLVEHLLKCGVKRDNMRLFVLKGEPLVNLPDENFDIVVGDIRNKTDVKKAMKNIDVVYHLAAVTRDNWLSYTDVNYNGTKVLIDECKRQKIKKIIFFSTIAVYGLPAFVGDRENITEDSLFKVEGEYAQSKYRAENLIKDSGLPYVIIRPTTVYGPRDRAGIYQLYHAIKNNYFLRIGNGNNSVDYVYVSDLVKGARLAQLSKKNGEYILGAQKPIKFIDLVKTVARVLNKKVPSWYIPRGLGLVLAYFTNLLSLPLSPNRVRVMTANYYFNSRKAVREINYNPKTSFRTGIKLTYGC